MTNESSSCKPTTFESYFAQLFEFDRWANRRVLATMETLGGRLPQRSVDRLSHLLICQELWIARLSGKTPPVEIFPTWPFAELQRRAPAIFESMEHWIAHLSEVVSREVGYKAKEGSCIAHLSGSFRLHDMVSYTSLDGEAHECLPVDALTQLYGHGCYHRGQIACELNPLLPEPLTTDYIYYVIHVK